MASWSLLEPRSSHGALKAPLVLCSPGEGLSGRCDKDSCGTSLWWLQPRGSPGLGGTSWLAVLVELELTKSPGAGSALQDPGVSKSPVEVNHGAFRRY